VREPIELPFGWWVGPFSVVYYMGSTSPKGKGRFFWGKGVDVDLLVLDLPLCCRQRSVFGLCAGRCGPLPKYFVTSVGVFIS